MNFDEFVGQVINRLELGSKAEGVRATRAVLTALGERLQRGEAEDLAGSLPMELDFYVLNADSGQKYSWDEFLDRIIEIEGNIDRADAAYRAQVVMDILQDTVPGGEMQDIRSNLPEEFEDLFELVESS